MKKTIIILALFALGGCATSERQQQEKQWDLLFITDSYAEKSPTIKEIIGKKDFN
jgi:hypothetical protein